MSPLTREQLRYDPNARHLARRKQAVPAMRPAGVSLHPQIAATLNRRDVRVESRGRRIHRWLRREGWRLALLGVVLVATLGAIMMLAAVLTHHQGTPADPPSPEVLAALSAAGNVTIPTPGGETPVAVASIQPTATFAVIAAVPATPQATVKPPAWLTPNCIYRMQVVGAGEMGGITDTLTLEVGMTQIVNTAIQSQCAAQGAQGSLENIWRGWLKFANSGTAPIIDTYIMHAADFALQHWQQPKYPLYSLFGSRADLHAWYRNGFYDQCDVVQGYPLDDPREFGLMCALQGK